MSNITGIVTVSSLTAKTPEQGDSILIADKYKTSPEDLEGYFQSWRPDIGRNLQTVLGTSDAVSTFATLRARADAGNFNGLRLADYIDVPSITIDGASIANANERLRFEIAGFDTYYNIGNTAIDQHHILMTAKNCVLQHAMNSTDDNTGGYPASELYTYLNGSVNTGLASAIGITPKTCRRLLDNKSSWDWAVETVFIPTEVEVFGCCAWSNNSGNSVGSSVQWPLFAQFPQKRIAKYNNSRYWWWEASPRTANSTNFCNCDRYGNAGSYLASNSSIGVRFAFLV